MQITLLLDAVLIVGNGFTFTDFVVAAVQLFTPVPMTV
jgi:hypothetical protein